MKKEEDYFIDSEDEPEPEPLPEDPPDSGESDGPKKENVGPTFQDVVGASLRPLADGTPAIDLRALDSFEGRYGYNGGKGCDVAEGPCSCGAWHDVSENKQLNPDWRPRSQE